MIRHQVGDIFVNNITSQAYKKEQGQKTTVIITNDRNIKHTEMKVVEVPSVIGSKPANRVCDKFTILTGCNETHLSCAVSCRGLRKPV